jgi:pimeloyl-ACP methyl ester carboxylesterase
MGRRERRLFWDRRLDISVARQAEYLAAWMRTIGLDRAVLVGHDLGGGVAQIVAVQHRELVRGLVLMNAIAYDSWPIPSVKAMQALGPLVARLPKGVFRLVVQLFIVQGHDNPACARSRRAAPVPVSLRARVTCSSTTACAPSAII